MKVKDLIEALQKFDPELDVMFYDHGFNDKIDVNSAYLSFDELVPKDCVMLTDDHIKSEEIKDDRT